jgi:predicted amidohydrolase
MTRLLHIGIASLCAKPGDIAGNIAQIQWAAQQAAHVGCDLLLTPEMSATGYGGYPEVVACAEVAGNGPIYTHLATMAHQMQIVLMAGFVEQHANQRYLAHYVVYPDGRFVVQRKNRVTPREYPLDAAVTLYFDESEEIGHVHASDADWQFFMVKDVRCGIVICADLGVKQIHTYFQQEQVELMLLPTGAGGTRNERMLTADLLDPAGVGIDGYFDAMKWACFPGDGIKECVRYRRALAAVNMCGYDGQHFYHGGQGSIIDTFGDVHAIIAGIPNLDRQRPRFAHAQIDFDQRLM